MVSLPVIYSFHTPLFIEKLFSLIYNQHRQTAISDIITLTFSLLLPLTTIKKLFISYILVNDSTIETPVSFAVEQLKTIGVCKKKQ